MIHLVTFSDHQMELSRRLCIESALKHGIDSVAGPHYFDPHLETRDGFTLEWLKSQPIYEQMGAEWWTQRGIGYWLWKPYIIDLVMSKLQDGDYLVYSDAGVEFINNIRYIIDRMDQDVWLFGNNWEHAHWCKRDVVEAVWPLPRLSHEARVAAVSRLEETGDEQTLARLDELLTCDGSDLPDPVWSRFGKQAQASVIVLHVSERSRDFVKAWLRWCRVSVPNGDALRGKVPLHRLIDDSPSIAPNHPEFREHRHDQAILTTLAYREGIKLHYWAAQYNDGAFVYPRLVDYASDDYPILFHHHRKRDHEWQSAA